MLLKTGTCKNECDCDGLRSFEVDSDINFQKSNIQGFILQKGGNLIEFETLDAVNIYDFEKNLTIILYLKNTSFTSEKILFSDGLKFMAVFREKEGYFSELSLLETFPFTNITKKRTFLFKEKLSLIDWCFDEENSLYAVSFNDKVKKELLILSRQKWINLLFNR